MKYGRNVRQALVMITQFSIEMLVPIAICSAIGWWIDSRFETSVWFVILFFVGAIAGGTNIYKFARKIYSDKSGDVRNRDRIQKDDSKSDS